jgi:hypothetical protein
VPSSAAAPERCSIGEIRQASPSPPSPSFLLPNPASLSLSSHTQIVKVERRKSGVEAQCLCQHCRLAPKQPAPVSLVQRQHACADYVTRGYARGHAVAPQVEGLGSCGAVLAEEEGRRRRHVS